MVSGNIPVQFGVLPEGKVGTDATIATMSRMAMGQYGARSPKIRALAINILKNAQVPEKEYALEMIAIHRWVRDTIRYTRDVVGQETLSYPEEVAFNSRAEDCDGKATLEAALLGAIGIATRFVVIGYNPDSYEHVYLEGKVARTKGGPQVWVPLDPIMREKPAGWSPPTPMIKKAYPENSADGFSVQGITDVTEAGRLLVPENVSTILQGLRGGTMAGALGYVGDPRVFVGNPSKWNRYVGTSQVERMLERQPDWQADNTNYVRTNSDLQDQDAPVDHLLANPPNKNIPQRYADRFNGTVPWRGGKLHDRTQPQGGQFSKTAPQEVNNQLAPDQNQPVMRNPNMAPLAIQAEGVDNMFNRPAKLYNGLPDLNYGAPSAAMRPAEAPTPVAIGGMDFLGSTAPAAVGLPLVLGAIVAWVIYRKFSK